MASREEAISGVLAFLQDSTAPRTVVEILTECAIEPPLLASLLGRMQEGRLLLSALAAGEIRVFLAHAPSVEERSALFESLLSKDGLLEESLHRQRMASLVSDESDGADLVELLKDLTDRMKDGSE